MFPTVERLGISSFKSTSHSLRHSFSTKVFLNLIGAFLIAAEPLDYNSVLYVRYNVTARNIPFAGPLIVRLVALGTAVANIMRLKAMDVSHRQTNYNAFHLARFLTCLMVSTKVNDSPINPPFFTLFFMPQS